MGLSLFREYPVVYHVFARLAAWGLLDPILHPEEHEALVHFMNTKGMKNDFLVNVHCYIVHKIIEHREDYADWNKNRPRERETAAAAHRATRKNAKNPPVFLAFFLIKKYRVHNLNRIYNII